jgi:hypothetical protein
MGMIATKNPSPQESINKRDYIQTRRKIEISRTIKYGNDSNKNSITS